MIAFLQGRNLYTEQGISICLMRPCEIVDKTFVIKQIVRYR